MKQQTVTVTLPDEKMHAEAQAMLRAASVYQITNDDLRDAAVEDLKAVKRRMADLDKQRKAITKPLDDAKKGVMDLFRAPVEWLEQAESTLKRAIAAYEHEQRRLRLQAEAEARDLAMKEQARLAAEARAAEAAGKTEEALEMREQAHVMPVAMVAAPAPKMAGVSMREDWDFEIIDASLLPREYLIADEKKIRGVVKALKEASNIPGVRVFAKDVVSARIA